MGIQALKLCFNITFYLYLSSSSIRHIFIQHNDSRQGTTLLSRITGINRQYGSGTEYDLFAFNEALFIIAVLLELMVVARCGRSEIM